MLKRNPKIPQQIDDQLSPEVRAFIHELIGGYEKRINQLERQLRKLTAENALLRKQNAALTKQVALLTKQVEASTLQNPSTTPQNSSLPPSTQHPHAKPVPKKPKPAPGQKPKKQGAQPGHTRNMRLLIPTDQCDHVLPLRPSQCRRCKRKLTGIDPAPLRHQVFEIPAPKPVITEYQQHRLTCSCGWTVKIQNLVSAALAAPYEELRGQLTSQPQLFVDESPTKQKKSKAWLWVQRQPAGDGYLPGARSSSRMVVDLHGSQRD